jgi:hypothetical protein
MCAITMVALTVVAPFAFYYTHQIGTVHQSFIAAVVVCHATDLGNHGCNIATRYFGYCGGRCVWIAQYLHLCIA